MRPIGVAVDGRGNQKPDQATRGVLGHVETTQAAGFHVNDDLSVQDTMTSYPNASIAITRQRQAELHAADIG
jgi:hypothetical protein